MPIAEKLDELGRPAWIALMILGFIAFWPLGLAILAFLIWSGRMSCGRNGHWDRKMMRMQDKMDRMRANFGGGNSTWGYRSSGNHAFDEYRATTIKRLEEEQQEFREFLERLRFAKDKQEFDAFMADRRNREQQPPQN